MKKMVATGIGGKICIRLLRNYALVYMYGHSPKIDAVDSCNDSGRAEETRHSYVSIDRGAEVAFSRVQSEKTAPR